MLTVRRRISTASGLGATVTSLTRSKLPLHASSPFCIPSHVAPPHQYPSASILSSGVTERSCQGESLTLTRSHTPIGASSILLPSPWANQRRNVMSVLSRKLVDRVEDLPPPQGRHEGFGALGVLPELTQLLVASDIKQPTSIQKLALPHLLANRDAVIAAQTGTGKTLAYVLPIAQQLIQDEREGIPVRPSRPRALIIVPSRELAAQVVAVAKQLCHHPDAKFRATMTSGGVSKHKQAQELAGTMSYAVKQERKRALAKLMKKHKAAVQRVVARLMREETPSSSSPSASNVPLPSLSTSSTAHDQENTLDTKATGEGNTRGTETMTAKDGISEGEPGNVTDLTNTGENKSNEEAQQEEARRKKGRALARERKNRLYEEAEKIVSAEEEKSGFAIDLMLAKVAVKATETVRGEEKYVELLKQYGRDTSTKHDDGEDDGDGNNRRDIVITTGEDASATLPTNPSTTISRHYNIDLLVTTPGRLVKLQESGGIHLSDVRYIAIDEADFMLSTKDYNKTARQEMGMVSPGRRRKAQNNDATFWSDLSQALIPVRRRIENYYMLQQIEKGKERLRKQGKLADDDDNEMDGKKGNSSHDNLASSPSHQSDEQRYADDVAEGRNLVAGIEERRRQRQNVENQWLDRPPQFLPVQRAWRKKGVNWAALRERLEAEDEMWKKYEELMEKEEKEGLYDQQAVDTVETPTVGDINTTGQVDEEHEQDSNQGPSKVGLGLKIPSHVRKMAQQMIRERRKEELMAKLAQEVRSRQGTHELDDDAEEEEEEEVAEEEEEEEEMDQEDGHSAEGGQRRRKRKGIVPVDQMQRKPFNTQFIWVGATLDNKFIENVKQFMPAYQVKHPRELLRLEDATNHVLPKTLKLVWVRVGNLNKLEVLANLLKDKAYRVSLESATGEQEEGAAEGVSISRLGAKMRVGRKPGLKGEAKEKEKAKKREALMLQAKLLHALDLSEDGLIKDELSFKLTKLIRQKEGGERGLMVMNKKDFEVLYEEILKESGKVSAGVEMQRQFDAEDMIEAERKKAEEERDEEGVSADEMDEMEEMEEEEEEEEEGDGKSDRRPDHLPTSVGEVSKETIAALKDLPSAIVFCNSVESCRAVEHELRASGISVSGCHGAIPPKLRRLNWSRFLGRATRVCVCTDLAARGIDTRFVTHIINFDMPLSPVEFIHRAGRTARAGDEGRVTTLLIKRDEVLAKAIDTAVRQGLPIINLSSDKKYYRPDIAPELRRGAHKLGIVGTTKDDEKRAWKKMKREERERAKMKESDRREKRHEKKADEEMKGLEVEPSGFKPGAIIKMPGMPKETALGKQRREQGEEEALRSGRSLEDYAKERGLESSPIYKKRIQREREKAWGVRGELSRKAKEMGTTVDDLEAKKAKEEQVRKQTMKYRFAMEMKAKESRGRRR